jgi:cytochrome c oxidase subunit II
MKNLIWPAALLLQACAGPQQSSIDSAGAPAAGIERLWWLFFWLLLAIFVIVMAFLGGSLGRKHRGIKQEPLEQTHTPSPETESRLTRTVAAATCVTVVILFALVVISVSAAKSITGPGTKSAMTVEVQGNQWWWYVRYLNDDASQIVITANELHIPVGKPVMIRGTSNDVIHSFWVPNLQGKRDLIPSRVTTEWIQADRPGRFRGQCAEFCGLQHAHMALWVVAEPQENFEKWMDAQRQPAKLPANDATQRGQQVFLNRACVFCHNITGTPAAGQVGPDLTHVGSRLSIAAGTLPNNRGNLGGWISDPQRIKPGTHMATVPVPPEDLQPLIEYLESLQ